MPKSDPVLAARSRIGVARRRDLGDAAERQAREDLAAAHVERAIIKADPPLTGDHRTDLITRLVEQAPPLTAEQTERVTAILRSGRQ